MYAPRVTTRISSTSSGEGIFDDTRTVLSKRTFYVIVLAISFAFTMVIVVPAATASSRRQRLHHEQDLGTEVVVPSAVPESGLSVVSSIEDNSTPDNVSVPTKAPTKNSPSTTSLAPVAKPTAASSPVVITTPTADVVPGTPAAPESTPEPAPVSSPTSAASSVSAPVAKPTVAPVATPTDQVPATSDVDSSVTDSSAEAATSTPTASPTSPPTDFPPIRINSGGPQKNVNENGKVWHTDVRAIKNVAIVGASEVYDDPCHVPQHDDLYCSERWFTKDGGYDVTVPDGEYNVALSFVEIFHGATGDRIFNIVIEGKPLRRQYDISKAAGEKKDGIARESFDIHVKDGVLNIEFLKVKQHPKISAVEITKVG